jgi:hypothetical protein
MGNPALIVRVAATLEELKKNLAEGVSQIETTTAAMGKLAASFSGDKLIQSAHNVVAAVNEIGGASKLTEAEQARVNATLEKALEKYRALGREAPPGMQKLADETRGADQASSGLTDTVKQLATGFLAMFTARAAFNFVKDTINEASALKDLGQQTHISVEEIQLLAGAMTEFGVDQDTLAKGLYKLSRGIAGGDESVARGLHMMGLSLQDVEGLNGQALFLKIEHGLSTLQGGLRDTAAAELFGGKLGSAMAGASEGIEGALEKWQRLNHVASTESVDAMDEFGESIARANKNLSSIAANLIGPVAQGFNVLIDAADKGASKWAITWAFIQDGFSQGITGTGTEHLAKLLDDLNQKTDANAKATAGATGAHVAAKVALDAHGQAAQFMASLELDSVKPLLAWQSDYLAHLKEIGALTAQNAAGIGVNAAQFAKYTQERTAAEAEFKKVEAEQLANAKLLDDFRHEAHARQVEIIRIQTDAQTKQAEVVNAAVQAEFEAQVKLNAAWGLDAKGALDVQHSALDTLNLAMEELHAKKVEGISQVKQEQVLMDAYTKSLFDVASATESSSGRQVAAIKGVIQTWGEAADAAARAAALASGIAFDIVGHRPGEGPGINGAPSGGFSLGPAFSLGPTTFAPSVLGSHKDGGPVSEGPAYLHNNEYVVPSGGALVMRGGGDGGGSTIHITINGSVLGTPSAIAAAIDDALTARLRSTGMRMPVGA